jgi:hypothetical protein
MYLHQAGLTRNPTFSYLYSVRCRGQAEGQEILHSPNGSFVPAHVIGIMKDFNFESYRDKVRPFAVSLSRVG